MPAIPGTYLPSDDDGSGVAREPVTEVQEPPTPEELQDQRRGDFHRMIMAALVKPSWVVPSMTIESVTAGRGPKLIASVSRGLEGDVVGRLK